MKLDYLQRRPLLGNLVIAGLGIIATGLAYFLFRQIMHILVGPYLTPWEVTVLQNNLAAFRENLPLTALILGLVYIAVGFVYQASSRVTREQVRAMNTLFTVAFTLVGFLLVFLLALATVSPAVGLLTATVLTLVTAPYFFLLNANVYLSPRTQAARPDDDGSGSGTAVDSEPATTPQETTALGADEDA